jgi:hypothetical protein
MALTLLDVWVGSGPRGWAPYTRATLVVSILRVAALALPTITRQTPHFSETLSICHCYAPGSKISGGKFVSPINSYLQRHGDLQLPHVVPVVAVRLTVRHKRHARRRRWQ